MPGATGDTQWWGGGGHLGTPRDSCPSFTPFSPAGSALAELEQDWQEGSGGGGGSLPPFPLFPPKIRAGPPPPIPPDPPSPPRRPRAVQRRIPGRLLPGPSRAPLPPWVSDTGHPEWVLHPPFLGCCAPPRRHHPLFGCCPPSPPSPGSPPEAPETIELELRTRSAQGLLLWHGTVRQGTGDRGHRLCDPSGWGSGCPLFTRSLCLQEPTEGGKAKDFLGLGLKDGHLVFR